MPLRGSACSLAIAPLATSIALALNALDTTNGAEVSHLLPSLPSHTALREDEEQTVEPANTCHLQLLT